MGHTLSRDSLEVGAEDLSRPSTDRRIGLRLARRRGITQDVGPLFNGLAKVVVAEGLIAEFGY